MLDAIIFVDEPPEIELRDGLFFLRFKFGESTIDRVMLPSTFARFMWRGEQALAAFRSGSNVVEFKTKVAPEELVGGHI